MTRRIGFHLAWILAIVASVATLVAGEFNKKLSVGDEAPEISELVGTDDKPHGLADFADKAMVVVVFTCNTCPYATDLDARLVAFAEGFAGPDGNVGLIAINPNKVAGDKPEDMKRRAEKAGFKFPYVWDETQAVATAYGATSTPECFVLGKAAAGKRSIVYMGAFDDSPDGKKVTKRHVDDAVLALLGGEKPTVTETQAIGCLVRYEKKRRPGK